MHDQKPQGRLDGKATSLPAPTFANSLASTTPFIKGLYYPRSVTGLFNTNAKEDFLKLGNAEVSHTPSERRTPPLLPRSISANDLRYEEQQADAQHRQRARGRKPAINS